MQIKKFISVEEEIIKAPNHPWVGYVCVTMKSSDKQFVFSLWSLIVSGNPKSHNVPSTIIILYSNGSQTFSAMPPIRSQKMFRKLYNMCDSLWLLNVTANKTSQINIKMFFLTLFLLFWAAPPFLLCINSTLNNWLH